MIKIRKANDRGATKLSWLDSRHSFSFGDYYDPTNEKFRTLRVINDDRIGPHSGFGMHAHRDMEIITYVLSGQLEHRDSLGNGSVIHAGEVQRMSAGTGILHSEQNSSSEPVHLYQIWITPNARGITPGYEQKQFEQKVGAWRTIVSPDGADGSMRIHQDASVHLATLDLGQSVRYDVAYGRHVWVQILRGNVAINGHELSAGDAGAISDEKEINISATSSAEVMLFDLA